METGPKLKLTPARTDPPSGRCSNTKNVGTCADSRKFPTLSITSNTATPAPFTSGTSANWSNSVVPTPPAGVNNGTPAAPAASGFCTRASSNCPVPPEKYLPPLTGNPKSPAEVGVAPLDPTTTAGVNTRAPAGNPAYRITNRVPTSVCGPRRRNASENPSVNRTEANRTRRRINSGNETVSGNGDCVQTNVVAYVANNPRCVMPTVNGAASVRICPAVTDASATRTGCSGVFGGAIRKFVIRSAAVPVADNTNCTLANVNWFAAVAVAGVFTIVSPLPLFAVITTSSAPFASSRFVIGPLNEISVNSPRIVAPGAPPEQFSTISPTRSLSPSIRKIVGTAVAWQFTPVAGWPHATPTIKPSKPKSCKRIRNSTGRIL